MPENDELEEALEPMTRNVMMAATVLGQRMAERRREQQARQASDDQQRAAQLQQRYQAERSAAVAQLQQVHDPSWMQAASTDEVAAAVTTATAWRGHDPKIDRAYDELSRQLHDRHGIDLANVDHRAALPHLQRREMEDRARADTERGKAAMNDRTAAAEWQAAEALDTDHDPAGQADRQAAAEAAEDTAARQRQIADRLDGTAEQAAGEARVRSSAAEAQPSQAAVNQPPRGAQRARPNRARGRGRALQRAHHGR